MAKPEDKKKKKVSGKEHDPSKYINVEPTLDEAARGTAVISWGRMNPMTVGHEKLVSKVASVAKAEKGMPHIFLTHSYDKKKNPLPYEEKIRLAQKAFGNVVKKSTAKTIIQLMVQLEKTYNKVVVVVGSDRVKEFNDLLQKYNGKDYKFQEIKVVSAGDRDPDADDVSGMSASKMRAAAASGDMNSFKKGLPRKLQSSAQDIYDSVRKGMNMSESEEIHIDDMEPLDEARVLTRQQRRKLGLRMKKNRHKMKLGRERAKRRMASREVLQKRAKKAARNILKTKFAKNRRYAELSDGEKEMVDKRIQKVSKQRLASLERKLLPKIKKAERERKKAMSGKKEEFDLNSRFEMFMEDYYKGVPKDKKDDREAHFKRYAEKPGDGADKDSNYKPAPGDFKDGKRVKTKVSQHTKNYKKMYGESEEWVCGVCHAEPCMCDGDNLTEAKGLWGTYVTKRPHMLMDANGKVKFDGRFKMYKQKNEEVDLESLMESTEEYALELNEDPTASLKKKAEKTGMPMGILRKVYNRGVAAWKSGHRPGTTPEQWGHARVNSFVTKSSGTWGKADADLAAKVRGSSKKESVDLDEGIIKPYHAIAKQPWSKTVKDSKGTAGEYKQIGKGKDFTVWYAYRGSQKSYPHYVVQNDKIIGSGMTVKAALKDAGLKDKDLTHRSKFADGSPLNKGMKEALEQIDEILDTPKAMDSYRNKAKASKEKAASSAVAKMVRSKDKDTREHPAAELKTMAKRAVGQKMVDRLAKRKTLKKLRGEEVEQLDELSPRTKASYLKKASDQNKKVQKAYDKSVKSSPDAFFGDDSPEDQKRMKTMSKRQKGIAMAKGRKYGQKYEEAGAGEEGTDKLVKKYKKDTPCSD